MLRGNLYEASVLKLWQKILPLSVLSITMETGKIQ